MDFLSHQSTKKSGWSHSRIFISYSSNRSVDTGTKMIVSEYIGPVESGRQIWPPVVKHEPFPSSAGRYRRYKSHIRHQSLTRLWRLKRCFTCWSHSGQDLVAILTFFVLFVDIVPSSLSDARRALRQPELSGPGRHRVLPANSSTSTPGKRSRLELAARRPEINKRSHFCTGF